MVNKTGTPIERADSDGDGNAFASTADLAAAFQEIDDLKTRLETTTASVAEYRALAEGRADELATIRAENDEIRRTLAGTDTDDKFVKSSELERIRTDLAEVVKDRADVSFSVSSGELSDLSQGVPGYEGGLLRFIIETYFSGDVARYRRAVENEARKVAAQ